MFIVCKRLSGKTRFCVSICRSKRIGFKVIQETIKYFGVAHNDEQRTVLVKLAEDELKKIKFSLKSSPAPSKDDPCCGALLGSMTEHSRTMDGFLDVFGAIFDGLNLSPHFTKLRYAQLRSEIEISILEDKISGKFYQLASKMSPKTKLIYRAIGLKRSDHPSELKMSKNAVLNVGQFVKEIT